MTPQALAAWRRVSAAARALLDAVDEALLTLADAAHDPAPALPVSSPTQVGQASEPASSEVDTTRLRLATSPQAAPQAPDLVVVPQAAPQAPDLVVVPQAAPQASASEALARPDVEPAAIVHAGEVAEPATPEPSPAVDTFATSARGPVPGGADAPAAQTTAAANDEADRHAPQADARALAPSTKRRYRRWTDADSAELRRLAATHCLGDVARLMDRHETSLKPWAQRLGVTFARWTRATTASPATPTTATTATDNPCTVDECDTAPQSPATTAAQEEHAPATTATTESSDVAARATTATASPATAATRARPLPPRPPSPTQDAVLVSLAKGPMRVVELEVAIGKPQTAIGACLKVLCIQGKVKRLDRGLYALHDYAGPVPRRRNTFEPARGPAPITKADRVRLNKAADVFDRQADAASARGQNVLVDLDEADRTAAFRCDRRSEELSERACIESFVAVHTSRDFRSHCFACAAGCERRLRYAYDEEPDPGEVEETLKEAIAIGSGGCRDAILSILGDGPRTLREVCAIGYLNKTAAGVALGELRRAGRVREGGQRDRATVYELVEQSDLTARLLTLLAAAPRSVGQLAAQLHETRQDVHAELSRLRDGGEATFDLDNGVWTLVGREEAA